MAFSYQDALNRISAEPEPVWSSGMTVAQQLQRLNEVLERFWTEGTWDGLLIDASPFSSTDGVITLNPIYKTLDSLVCNGAQVSIKAQNWKYSPSAPKVSDWTKYRGPLIAFDLGDGVASFTNLVDSVTGQTYLPVSSSGALGIIPIGTPVPVPTLTDSQTGQNYTLVAANNAVGLQAVSATPQQAVARSYQVAGDPSYLDKLTFGGMARLRYMWATSVQLANQVVPDCFQALIMGVRAFHWYDVGDTSRAERDFQTALAILERNLNDVLEDEDLGEVTVDWETSGGSICNLM
jgi:hypothetical protein